MNQSELRVQLAVPCDWIGVLNSRKLCQQMESLSWSPRGHVLWQSREGYACSNFPKFFCFPWHSWQEPTYTIGHKNKKYNGRWFATFTYAGTFFKYTVQGSWWKAQGWFVFLPLGSRWCQGISSGRTATWCTEKQVTDQLPSFSLVACPFPVSNSTT